MRVVQIRKGNDLRLAVVEEPRLRLVAHGDLYFWAARSCLKEVKLTSLIHENLTDETIEYDAVYHGNSDWILNVPVEHPGGPARTLVSGTGLTHLGSAKNRQAMHSTPATEENISDSMKMFRRGIEGGKPAIGQIGISPEWFYKGPETVLRAPGMALDIPAFAEGGGEEAEIAGIYLIDPAGNPRRIGMTTGNEFSDHKFEKRNYLNLAGSKMRNCSIGPEVVIDPVFDSVAGEVRIERNNNLIWSKSIATGQTEMCHSLANIEHHHFKFDAHRTPGDLHVHYFGACALSFGDGIQLLDGDVMAIRWDGFGRELRNPVHVIPTDNFRLIGVPPMM